MSAPSKYALLTLEEGRDYLKIDEPSSGDDDRICMFIDWVTAAIERWTARKLVSRTYDAGAGNPPKMVLSGKGSDEIAFREVPVTACSAMVRVLDDGTTMNVDLTGARLLHGGRRLWAPRDFFVEGQSNYQATCVAGYLEGTHDTELRTLKLAACRYLQVVWQDRSLAVGRGANIAVGGESVSFIEQPMPKDIVQLLRPFERWW